MWKPTVNPILGSLTISKLITTIVVCNRIFRCYAYVGSSCAQTVTCSCLVFSWHEELNAYCNEYKQTASSTPHLLSKPTTYVIMSLYSITFARPQCCVGSNPEDPSLQAPIRVAPKPTACSAKKSCNVFYDNRGHPDDSEAYDQLLHNIDGGTILRKKKCPTPPIDVDDPTFNHVYSEELHGELLWSQLDLSHLLAEDANALLAVIKEY